MRVYNNVMRHTHRLSAFTALYRILGRGYARPNGAPDRKRQRDARLPIPIRRANNMLKAPYIPILNVNTPEGTSWRRAPHACLKGMPGKSASGRRARQRTKARGAPRRNVMEARPAFALFLVRKVLPWTLRTTKAHCEKPKGWLIRAPQARLLILSRR